MSAMGIAGSAWATCVVRGYTLLLLVAGTARAFSVDALAVEARMFVPSRSRLAALVGLGWPNAIESAAELGVSTYMSLLCSRLGEVMLAAHQVVLDLSAFAYQAPAGLSYATVARVGRSAGRSSETQVQRDERQPAAWPRLERHRRRGPRGLLVSTLWPVHG